MDNSSKINLIKQIKRYQHHILSVDPPENDVPRVLHYIRKLEKLPIKLEELEETGIGKTINALRKRNGNIAEEAALLVAKWKSVVRKQVEEEEDESDVTEKDHKLANRKHGESLRHERSHTPEMYDASKSESHSNKFKTEFKKSKSESDNSKKESTTKNRIHLIKIKSRDSGERKRPSSELNSNVESKKYKSEKKIDCSPDIDEETFENCVQKKDTKDHFISSSENTFTNSAHSRENGKSDAKNEKNHGKSHKSSKHKHKDSKRHRDHSKNARVDKKVVEENDDVPHKHRKDSKSHITHKSETNYKNHKNNKECSNKERKRSKSSDNADVEDCLKLGDDFGAALLSIPQVASPSKKRTTSSKTSIHEGSTHSSSPQRSVKDFDLFSNGSKLEPLDLENYLKHEDDVYSPPSESSFVKSTQLHSKLEEDMLNSMIVTKNQRTKVYSGNKCVNMKFPTLFELCARVLQENFDALEYTGGVPYDVLKPILEKISVQQLYTFENYNPYLIGETDELWKYHATREFRKAERMEYESWRDLYLRCVEEREEKLQSLRENITQSIANSAPVRKTKLTYIDSAVKPPRNVAKSQAKHGTGNFSTKKTEPSSSSSSQSVKDRLLKESMGPNAIQCLSKSNLLVKKKKAPLMQKTLQLFKGLKR